MADIEIRQESPTAFYIKVHETDNVAIIVNDNGLKAGTRFPDGLELIEHIPRGHKVALVDIPVHGEIVRYGEVIGYAVRDIHAAAGLMNQWLSCPRLRRWRRCRWQLKCLSRYRLSRVIPSKVTAMLTVALAPESARHLHQRALRGGRGGLCSENH